MKESTSSFVRVKNFPAVSAFHSAGVGRADATEMKRIKKRMQMRLNFFI
jgi:predicted TIM-barrel enzyme